MLIAQYSVPRTMQQGSVGPAIFRCSGAPSVIQSNLLKLHQTPPCGPYLFGFLKNKRQALLPLMAPPIASPDSLPASQSSGTDGRPHFHIIALPLFIAKNAGSCLNRQLHIASCAATCKPTGGTGRHVLFA